VAILYEKGPKTGGVGFFVIYISSVWGTPPVLGPFSYSIATIQTGGGPAQTEIFIFGGALPSFFHFWGGLAQFFSFLGGPCPVFEKMRRSQ
jgi:hypothetical protein